MVAAAGAGAFGSFFLGHACIVGYLIFLRDVGVFFPLAAGTAALRFFFSSRLIGADGDNVVPVHSESSADSRSAPAPERCARRGWRGGAHRASGACGRWVLLRPIASCIFRVYSARLWPWSLVRNCVSPPNGFVEENQLRHACDSNGRCVIECASFVDPRSRGKPWRYQK